ncbi:hypothetical protein PAB09_09885 [Corynebacterium sp. SCR221107]|uniref:hypothetical protein n=1 Tax=Corynebacterium sp. SCR221107 TaxID=3017361 RepID=UPI0022EC77B9|nr:hypothetical protein [Corynebacterium sp. SCR221107]WBT08196.1 hypothetical protein PAB09_09885 [Corynebacterium sp. SCR221107]
MRTNTLNALAAVLCLIAIAAKLLGMDIPAFIAIFVACIAGVLALVLRVREHGEFVVEYTDEQKETIASMLRLGDERGAITQTHLWCRGITDQQAQEAVAAIAADYEIELGEAGHGRPF